MSQEFKDSLDNTNWMYNCTILKMMADLNSKTLVTLGDSRHKACLLFSRNRVGLDGNCLPIAQLSLGKAQNSRVSS